MTQTRTTFSSSSATALDAYFHGLETSKPLSAEKEAERAGAIDAARAELWANLLGERTIQRSLHSAISSELKLDEETKLDLEAASLIAKARRRKGQGDEARERSFVLALGSTLAALDRDDALAGVLTRDVANLSTGTDPVVHLRVRKGTVGTEGFESFCSTLAASRGRLHRAKTRMAEANLRLVVQMAKRYTYSSIPLMDLVQEGNIGLLKAVDRFEVGKGFRFSTYASWWIRHALTRCVYNGSSTVRVPVHVQERHRQIAKARRDLELKSGDVADVADVAEVVGISVEKVRTADGVRSYRTLSFHAPAHPGSMTSLEETLADPEQTSSFDFVSDAGLRESIEPAFSALTSVEFDILKRRFGLEGEEQQTLRAVGAVHGLSRERIRQIQTRALEKMRECIESGAVAN
jgi:RNA polymerase primary sigma factor